MTGKRIHLTFLSLFIVSLLFADIPVGYYTNASGKSGAELKTSLYQILKEHKRIPYGSAYGSTWTVFRKSDVYPSGITGHPEGSIWDMYSDMEINAFHNNVGSYVGNDMYHKYESDIQLLKSMNFESFRTSMQWTRLLDQDGNINPEGAKWYHQLIDCAHENGIEIFMNMYHFDMPEYLVKRGGWQNREVVEAYANFVKKAMEEFGQKIKYWFTFNEPIVEPEQQFFRHSAHAAY